MTNKDMPETVRPAVSPEGMHTLSVTEAARNFSDLVNRAFYQGSHFRLTRGGRAVAELYLEDGAPERGSQPRHSGWPNPRSSH